MEKQYIGTFTEEELLIELSKRMYGTDTFIDKKVEKEMFEKASGVDGLMDYLHTTLEADIHRYFSATTEKERDMIRGAYSRTAFFKSMLVNKADKKTMAKKLTSKRHA